MPSLEQQQACPSNSLPPTPNADALATGLYLLDNQPISASSPLSTSATSSDARTLPIWSGLGVHHLELHVEPTRGSSTSLHGLAVGLVAGAHGQLEIRMWSLASLVNLAKWRAFDEVRADMSPRRRSACSLRLACAEFHRPRPLADIDGRNRRSPLLPRFRQECMVAEQGGQRQECRHAVRLAGQRPASEHCWK